VGFLNTSVSMGIRRLVIVKRTTLEKTPSYLNV
jgi:hypothetical protein